MINYVLLGKAIEFYQAEGYTYIEVPWAVDYVSIMKTAPTNSKLFYLENNYLVASAEQSFIQLMNQLQPDVKYMSCTPCFRDELKYDFLHQKYFMKLELFSLNQIDHLSSAKKFFEKEKKSNSQLIEISTDFGKDLYLNGVEIGSYYNKENYSCGTGLAEPRFSIVNELIKL